MVLSALIISLMLCGCSDSTTTSSNQTVDASDEVFTNIQEYILSNNENHIFDGTVGTEVDYSYSYTFDNPGIPLSEDTIQQLANLDSIKSINPIYTLYSRTPMQKIQKESYPIQYTVDNASNTVDLKDSSVSVMTLNPILNDDLYHEAMVFRQSNQGVTDQKILIKEFESQSGIYIPQELYDVLNVNSEAKTLQITLDINIPLYYSLESSPNDVDCRDTYNVDFETKTITLDVQGVKQSIPGFHNFNNIDVPYQLAKEIYDSVDFSQVNVPDGCEPYQPNSFLICVSDGVTKDQLANDIQGILTDFVLTDQSYGANNDDLFFTQIYTK